MAAGDTLLILTPAHGVPPAANGATWDTLAGASTPAEAVPFHAFDDTTVEYTDYIVMMPRHYGGNGITLTFAWSSTATTGTAVLSAAFRRIQDDAEDLDTTAQTYDYNNTGALTPASAAGEVVYDTLAFTDGADMDSVAAGEAFVLRVRRVPTDGNDNMTGDLRLHSVEVRETP